MGGPTRLLVRSTFLIFFKLAINHYEIAILKRAFTLHLSRIQLLVLKQTF